jgi:hypothetical protein
MGKKKSVVLITLISIVIAVLCAITLFPSFELPFRVDGTFKTWNPVVKQYDLGSEFGGGYYTYYYPEGVIPASEYDSNYENFATDEEKSKYADKYVAWKGLYLEKAESSIFDDADEASVNTISADFKANFTKAAGLVVARFQDKGYSASRVAVVDDYALRVELPASEKNYATTFATFANVGEIELQKGGVKLEELEENSVSDYVKEFKVGTKNKAAYVEMKLTKEGKELVKGLKGELSSYTATGESATTLDVVVGGETILQIYSDFISDKNEVISAYNIEYLDVFEGFGVLLNSALKDGSSELTFKAVSNDSIRTFEPVYGDNALTLLYIALGVILLACIVLPIVFYRGYGVSSMYSTLSYLTVVAICFAFISKGVFEVTLGSVLIFVFGLVLVNLINAKIYQAVKAEVMLGKTVESAVKAGYKKTLGGIIDVYVIALVAGLTFLIGVAGFYTMALQTLICVITGAFCNLLWGRLINYLYLSASKDKYKYFHFVREDDDDE